MCENDSVGKKSEEKPAVPAPVVSGGSGGVAKIFILTPEILQTLGLTSYTNARIASKNATNAIKFTIPIAKDLQGTNADQKGSNKPVITIGKLVDQSIGCTTVIKKPKTDGASAQNSSDAAESSKSSTPSSAEADRRLKGVNDESAAATKIETPICPTPPKAKNARRKSNAAPSPVGRTRERSGKNAVDEKIESEASPVVRSSRRVAKPKKFDDFVLTETSPIFVRGGDEAGTSEKSRSRRSSQNSESPQPAAKIGKKGAGKGNRKVRAEATVVGVGDETTQKKIDDFVLRENPPISGRVGDEAGSSLNSDSAQPAAKIGKKGKADQKGRAEATVVGLGDETVAKKRVEEAVSGEETSGVLKSPSENCFTVPDPPSSVRKKPLDGAREKPSPKATSSELGEKKSSLREDGFAVPKSPTSFAKKKFQPKLIQRPTGEINVRERSVEKEGPKISACEQGRSETKERLPTSRIVSEDVEEKSLATATVKLPTIAREHFDAAKPDPPSTSLKTEEVGLTRSDKKNKVRASKSMAPRSRDNIQETEGPKSDPLRQLGEDEKTIDSKSDPQGSARGNERTSDSELFPLNALDGEAGGSKSDPKESSDRRERIGSKAIPRRSVGKTQNTIGSKTNPLSSSEKRENAIVTKSDPLRSPDEEKIIGTKLDTPSTSQKTDEVNSSKAILARFDKKIKVRVSKAIPRRSLSNIRRETEASKSDALRQLDKEKIDSECDPPRLPVESAEARVSKSSLLESSDKIEVTCVSELDSPISPHEDAESSSKSDPLKSVDKKEEENKCPPDSPRVQDKTEESGTKTDIPKSSGKKDKAGGIVQIGSLRSPDKKEEVSVSQIASPRALAKRSRDKTEESTKTVIPRSSEKTEKTGYTNTPDKNEEVGVSQFALPRSREKTEDRAKTVISRSSGKEEQTARKSQITSSRCSDEKEEVANSGQKTQAKKEEVAISEFASPTSQVKKEEVISEIASPRSQAKKEGIGISEFASPRSQAKKEGIGISEFASPRSQAKKEGIGITEFASPRSQAKKEEVISEFASPRSQVKKEEVISEFASPRSQVKKEGTRISEFASPRSSKANTTSPTQQPFTYIKEELIIPDSDSACSLDGSEGPGHARWSSSTSSDKRRVDFEFSDVQMNQDRPAGEQAEEIDIFELVSPRPSNKRDEVDVFQLTSPSSQPTSEEVFCAESDVVTFTELQEGAPVFFFDSAYATETIEITEYIESEIPMSPGEAQTDSELFDIQTEEDRPTDASTEIPSTNEAFEDSEFPADNSLDEAFWAETTHADDAISSDSAADESTESPVPSTAYSEKGRLLNSSNSAESSSVIETDAPTKTGSSEVVEAYSRKERSRKSSNSTESSSIIETDAPTKTGSSEVVEAYSRKGKALKPSSSTESLSVIETDAPTEIESTKVVEACSRKEKSLKSSNWTESSSVIKTNAPRKTGSSEVVDPDSRKEKSLKSSNSTESSSVIKTNAPRKTGSSEVVDPDSRKEKSLKSSNSTESSSVIKTDAPRKTGSSEVVEAYSRKENSLKSSNSTESSSVIKTNAPKKPGRSEVLDAYSRKGKLLKPSNSTESSSVIETDAPIKTRSSEVVEAHSRKGKSLKRSNSTESSSVIETDAPTKTGSSEVVEAHSRKGKSLKSSNSTESSSAIETDVPTKTGSSEVVEANSKKGISLKSSNSTESSSVIETDVPTETGSTEVVEANSTKGISLKSSNSTESSSVIETDVPTETGSSEVVETPVETSSRSKRPVRKMENVTDGKGLSDGSEDDAEKIEVKPRRRGRPPGVITQGPGRGRGRSRGRGRGRGRGQMDTEYVPRTNSSGKDKTATGNSGEVDDSLPAAVPKEVGPLKPGEVECGKCKERMLKKNWTKHNLMHHNNMGWLSGDPEPDFEENVKLLRSILMAALKKKKKGQLICETCGAGKRSANGFISHLQFCGKTEDERQSLMLTCPICKNVMMPSSMEMHERFHRQEEKAAEEKKLAEEKIKEEIVVNDPSSGRGKRKAAEKAATKISEFTDLVKEDEPANKKRRRTKDELIELIAKPQSGTNPPNRWKGMWKNEIAKDGKARCRQQGCSFTAESLEAICAHYPECTFSPRLNYVCKLCFFSSQTEEETMKHVEARHSMSKSKEAADSDFENTGSSSSSNSESELSDTKPAAFRRDDRYQLQDYNVRFLDEAVKVDARWPFTYPPALRWTMEFERKNYRLRLFEDFSPNPMRLLEHEESLDYLPQLSRSMKIRESDGRGTTPASWIQWERFEGTVTAGIPTCFAGGPVWAIAWLPIPAPMYDQAVDQFVAVSTHSTMESVYAVGKSYVGNNVVQIWNLGPLDHSKSTATNAPVLAYGVAHDKGTIWCMEWCPSGCYEDPSLLASEDNREASTSKRRMGLLAAACSDGCVHVFSLPFPEEIEFAKNDDDSRLPIYETKPILTLTISTHMYDQGEQNWQCTKLNWCRELGHDTIIAGFSNGHIAMWDLTSESPLFVTTRGDTIFIDAFHHFYAHGHAISAVQMIPYGGKRFFVTSSYDRMTKLWDLEDTSFPVTGLRRGIVVDAAWLTHWPAYIAAYDDVLTHAHTYLLSLRQPGAKIFPLLPTNSPTYSVATSDYGNSVSHGTLAGEVVVMFPNHLWSPKDMERLAYKQRWLATTVEVVDFESEKTGSKRKNPTSDYEYMPETYDGCKDRYGLVFRDRLSRTQHCSRKIRSKSGFSEKLKSVHVEQYPFASANRVSWNPNAWSYLWMCVAYQNGLVRFLNFNAVSLDTELRKLLPSHAKAMLNEARTVEPDSAENNTTIDPSDSRSES